MTKNPPPKVDGAPGHRWQARAGDRWVCIWVARGQLVKAGYSPKTQRIWPPTETPDAELDETAMLYIRSECNRLQDDMRAWQHGPDNRGARKFSGTINSLIECYQTDPDSPYQDVRVRSKRSYDSHLRMIAKNVGKRYVSDVKGRDLKRWFENWAGDGAHIPTAAGRMTLLRMIIGFGSSILEDPHCSRLRVILSDLKFEQGKRREVVLDIGQIQAIRAQARAIGCPSMALAEAMKFSLIVRPKDVIGEWVPITEPGISAVTRGAYKWLFGYDWREIGADFVLTHRLSKSLRGRKAILRPDAGKTLTYNLRLYPMVMEELALMAGCAVEQLRRDMFPAAGPMVIEEATGQPYHDATYRKLWREIADGVRIPKNIQSRDGRASGATHAKRLGASLPGIQQAMGHSKIDTTLIYLRDDNETIAEVAEIRWKQGANKQANND